MAKVIEYRGCGIQYTNFEGTVDGCITWLENNCVWVEYLESYRPKDDEEWIYYIIDDLGISVPDSYIKVARVKNN